jgi:hypothetical protein
VLFHAETFKVLVSSATHTVSCLINHQLSTSSARSQFPGAVRPCQLDSTSVAAEAKGAAVVDLIWERERPLCKLSASAGLLINQPSCNKVDYITTQHITIPCRHPGEACCVVEEAALLLQRLGTACQLVGLCEVPK